MKIMLINGPNLNLLGVREPGVYGTETLHTVIEKCQALCEELGAELVGVQSNSEGEILDAIHGAMGVCDGIVINPGAYTHYSYAIHDALKSLEDIIKVEVHISDIQSREEFRKVSVTAPACHKQIYGHGLNGYLEAMDYIREIR